MTSAQRFALEHPVPPATVTLDERYMHYPGNGFRVLVTVTEPPGERPYWTASAGLSLDGRTTAPMKAWGQAHIVTAIAACSRYLNGVGRTDDDEWYRSRNCLLLHRGLTDAEMIHLLAGRPAL